MSKTKKLLIALMLLIAVLLIPNMVNATVEYTRNFPSNDGTIELNLTGLELSDSKQYEFALVSKGGTPGTDSWNLITNYTTNTAKLVLSSGTTNIINVLKVTDEGQIFVREKDNTEGYVVDRLNVDLTLPYLQSLTCQKETDKYNCAFLLYGAIGNQYAYLGDANHTYVKWEKIEDTTLITEFLEIKSSNESVTKLESYLPARPTEDWLADRVPNCSEKNDGLYLLWVKRTGENCKEVYSCIIHDGLPDATTLEEYVGVINGAPTVEKVRATGSSFITNVGSGSANLSWEYHEKPGNQVTIAITFDQAIVKNTAPTLTIKFGTGNNIELTTCEAGSNTLTYTYKVKQGDLGTLQIVSFTGGNVTNNEGTAAVLTLPELSGYKVVAVEGDGTQEEPIDTTKYISFPIIIYNGKGSVDLYSGVDVDNYTMHYQFVEISDEVYNKLQDLKEKYDNKEITYEEYFVQYNEIVTKYNDNNWIKTEDGSFEQDLSKFTGTKKFALWVKLVMDDKTVYESQIYTMDGSGAATNEPDEQEKTNTTDTTLADKNLPNTGKVLLFWIIGIVTVSGTAAFVRYKKLYM